MKTISASIVDNVITPISELPTDAKMIVFDGAEYVIYEKPTSYQFLNSYSMAERINSQVNALVQYKTDLEQYSKPEFWIEANTFGDCEDYALLKRQVLLKSGFEHKDLHLALCWVETGEYHCVLLCNTDKGWFVLDNRYAWPMTPKSLPYRWDKALDEVDGKWYELSF